MGYAFSILLAATCFCPGFYPLPWRQQLFLLAMILIRRMPLPPSLPLLPTFLLLIQLAVASSKLIINAACTCRLHYNNFSSATTSLLLPTASVMVIESCCLGCCHCRLTPILQARLCLSSSQLLLPAGSGPFSGSSFQNGSFQ